MYGSYLPLCRNNPPNVLSVMKNKKCIVAFSVTIIAFLLILGIGMAQATEPVCGEITYTKTSDFSDARVSINFENGDEQIDVSGLGGWSVTEVALDVDNDNHVGFWVYATGPVSNFNPPGGDINSARVKVFKACPSPSPSPSSSPSSSPSPSPSPSPTPTETVSPSPTPCDNEGQTCETPTPTPTQTNPPRNESRGSSGGGGGSYAKCSEGWLKYVHPNDPDCSTPTPVPSSTPAPSPTPLNIVKAGQVQTGMNTWLMALAAALGITAGWYVITRKEI